MSKFPLENYTKFYEESINDEHHNFKFHLIHVKKMRKKGRERKVEKKRISPTIKSNSYHNFVHWLVKSRLLNTHRFSIYFRTLSFNKTSDSKELLKHLFSIQKALSCYKEFPSPFCDYSIKLCLR